MPNSNKRQNKKKVPKGGKKNGGRNALGRLATAAVGVAKKLPIIGDVVDKIDTVASSICSFLGLGSSLFAAHYTLGGKRLLVPHNRVEMKEGSLFAPGDIQAGDILMKIYVSPGPEGSRSRIMSQLYEKVAYKSFQLEVLPMCAATESGSLAFVYIPDPADVTLEGMDATSRLASVMSRENVRVSQIWQATVLAFPLTQKDYFVNYENSEPRLTTPGHVYVLAMSALDPLKLPTIRQTAKLTFTRSALTPSGSFVENAALSWTGDTLTSGGTHMVTATVIPMGDGLDSDRVTRVSVRDTHSVIYTTTAIKLRAGEKLIIHQPENGSAIVTDGIFTSDTFREVPVEYVYSGVVDEGKSSIVPFFYAFGGVTSVLFETYVATATRDCLVYALVDANVTVQCETFITLLKHTSTDAGAIPMSALSSVVRRDGLVYATLPANRGRESVKGRAKVAVIQTSPTPSTPASGSFVTVRR